jgi:hypothetical protein
VFSALSRPRPPRCASCGSCRPERCCVGTASSSPCMLLNTRADDHAGHPPHRRSGPWC